MLNASAVALGGLLREPAAPASYKRPNEGLVRPVRQHVLARAVERCTPDRYY